MITPAKFLRLYHTLKYLKLRQTVGRIWAHKKRKLGLFKLPLPPENLSISKKSFEFLNHDPWNSREELLKGNFTFLNETEKLGWTPDWRQKDKALLWQYNLHYFGYLYLLPEKEKVHLCENWIDNNPSGKTMGWDPYPLSLRIVNWCKSGIWNNKILKSLYSQSAYLFRNIEYYFPANHLLENARALVFAGLYFGKMGEAEKWFRRGEKILKREIPIQVLKDGGYFERTTMYHSIMLNLFLDVYHILPEKSDLSHLLKETIANMSCFLRSVTHPGGEISLFNDSTNEIAPSTEEVLEYSSRLINSPVSVKKTFRESGFYIHSNKDIFLIIDGGIIGPDFIPAHSHADIFTYELSLRENKVIVDSGVYEYPAGEMRNYVRSTRAHNTVMVDNLDQAECWDSFRVARRFKPENVKFTTGEGFSKFEGCFAGYQKMIGDEIKHYRTIVTDEKQRRILIEDRIKGIGSHLAESFIHIHPDFDIIIEGSIIRVSSSRAEFSIIVEEGDIKENTGWYCPEFGLKLNNKVITISSSKLPANLRYYFLY